MTDWNKMKTIVERETKDMQESNPSKQVELITNQLAHRIIAVCQFCDANEIPDPNSYLELTDKMNG